MWKKRYRDMSEATYERSALWGCQPHVLLAHTGKTPMLSCRSFGIGLDAASEHIELHAVRRFRMHFVEAFPARCRWAAVHL